MSKFGTVNLVQIRESRKTCHAIVSFARNRAAKAAVQAEMIPLSVYNRSLFLKMLPWRGPVGTGEKELEVSNLPFISDEVKADLEKFFRRFGIIQNIRLHDKTDRSFKPQLSAFIAFDSESSVDAALKADPVYFYGKYLLKLAKSEGRADKTDILQMKGKNVFNYIPMYLS